MKILITVLVGLLCLVFSAQAQQKPLDKTISVNYQHITLEETLADLQRRYDLNFSYANTDPALKSYLTLSLNNQTAREVLVKVLTPFGLTFVEIGNNIILRRNEAIVKQAINQQDKITLSGFVREKGSLETLPGATIYIPQLQRGAVSNNYGFYTITVPPGSYVVEYSFVGFKKVTEELLLQQPLKHDALIEQSNILKEVTVSANKALPVSQDNRISTMDISIANIKRMPALAGEKDVFKVIQMYPGVQRGVEGTSGFYVRGGTVDQNLVILDDAPVYNANHAFGLFSIFNGDAIKSAELIKGGFPARYGERLSSVVVMNMKDGNKEKLGGEVGIGLISSRFTLEGPIQKDKSSFIISGRRTYGDLFVQPFLDKGVSSGYYFYDLNAKVNTELDSANHFYLSAYLGKDKMYNNEDEDDYESRNNLGWGNQTITARWSHIYNSKTFGNASLIYSNYTMRTNYSELLPTEQSSSSYTSQIRDLGLKYDLDYAANPSHALRFGVRSVTHHFDPSAIKNTGTAAYQNSAQGQGVNSWENNAYAEDNWTISKGLSANIGVRASSFTTQNTTYFNAEPRISTRVLIAHDLALKGSYSVMNQYLNLLSNTNVGLPTDLWVPATKNIRPQRSQQVALGIAKDIGNGKYALTIEAYHKKMDNMISYKEGATLINIDIGHLAQAPKAIDWEDNVTAGKGKSNGVETFFEKKEGRLTGWVGYTLSWTKFQFADINGGEPFRPLHDRRHNLTAVGIYDINNHIKVSMGWTYLSGSPITVMQSNYTIHTYGPTSMFNYMTDGVDFGNNMAEYSKKGAYITDAYHRLDIGIQFIKQKKHGIRTWDFSVYNAYAKFNPFYYNYEQNYDFDKNTVETRLKKYSYTPFVPSITYSYKF